MRNPFRDLEKKEWLLWSISVIIVAAANFMTGSVQIFTLLSTLIGVTALIFVARGDVWGQVLTVVFAVLYSVTSFQFRYYGEIATYLGMTAPIAAMAVVSWLRNPYEKGKNVVKIYRLKPTEIVFMCVLTAAVTTVFYFILEHFDTPNIVFSTISVTTSFLASYLTFRRSSYYALAYAANDVVLIVLWIKAAMEDISYLPMIMCFVMFLANDLYGFISWKIREKKQRAGASV